MIFSRELILTYHRLETSQFKTDIYLDENILTSTENTGYNEKRSIMIDHYEGELHFWSEDSLLTTVEYHCYWLYHLLIIVFIL